MRRSSAISGSRSIIPRWTSAAHRTASTTLANSASVAGVLDDAAPVLPDLRIDQLPEMRLEAFVRTFLVRAHEARIARYIGGKNRGKTAFRLLPRAGRDRKGLTRKRRLHYH
jgi:hypothetical protein